MIDTTLCYITRGKEVLMLHRVKKQNDVNKDKWIGIGGRFEEGESPEECLLREVREETGLTLTRYRYRGLVTFVSNEAPAEQMHLFTADQWTGVETECDEGDLQWLPKEKLYEIPHWEGDEIFLRLLETDEPFFSLKLCYEGSDLVRAVLNGERIR